MMCRDTIFKVKYILTIFATVSCCSLFAQRSSTLVPLIFNQGSAEIVENYNLHELDSVVDSVRRSLIHVEIFSYTSPDGSYARNVELSKQRGESVSRYLIDALGLPDSIIMVNHMGIAWDRLESICQHQDLPCTESVKEIIREQPVQIRNQSIMALDGGETYDYLLNNIYPSLRYANVILHSQSDDSIKTSEEEMFVTSPVVESEPAQTPQGISPKPLFAIKTNLLFDLATLINFEIEIPIKSRWSIATEYIFPWWVMDNHKASSRRNRLQLLCGNFEGRYWWGDRESKPILTGWFAGLYVGVGSYDFEYDAKGYQGEFYVAAGLSGGYAHIISKNQRLRMEYSLGVGYLTTNYQYYHAEFCVNDRWHAIEQCSGKYSWFGPTRAKISISWLISSKKK